MNEPSMVIAEVCKHLANGDRATAADALRSGYPFRTPTNPGRRYTPREMCAVLLRDGFVDRYSGDRLIFPPVLRVISAELPAEFPAHPNWKMSETHVAYWDLFPTIDHLVPVSRGGADDQSNWVTTSMARNAAKGSSSLEQIGWELHPCGNSDEWDGLSGWIVDYIGGRPDRETGYVGRWVRALTDCLRRQRTAD